LNRIHVLCIVFIIVTIDQISKIWVKTHLKINEKIEIIENLFYINFTENPGFAFGLEFGGSNGKLYLMRIGFRI